MKTIKSIIGIAALGLAMMTTGCTTMRDQVPATQIKGTLNNQPFSFTGPKDVAIDSMDVVASTNGLELHVKGLNAKTNPDIITTTGDAQAKITAAQGAAVVNAFDAGGKAAATAFGAAK